MTSCNSLPTDGPGQILQGLLNVSYAKAKRWTNTLTAVQAGAYVAGVVAVFAPAISLSFPPIALGLALLNAWITARANRYKGVAETLKRQHEHWDGFGERPSARMLGNLRASLPDRLRSDLDALLKEGITYASTQSAGPVRALENLRESAFHSQHYAAFCAVSLRAIFVLTFVVALGLLLVSALTVTDVAANVAAARCVSATLLFVLSVGTIRAWLGFARFSAKSEQIDAEASRLLEQSTPDARDVQRLLGEYQLARASAPLIPTYVWRLRRKRLNQIWADRTTST